MDYRQIVFEKKGRVGVVTLNRPEKLNAWTYQMMAEIRHAIDSCVDDRDVGAIVITGAGRAFCTGADIAEVFKARADSAPGSEVESVESPAREATNWAAYLKRLPKPTIAALNGVAIGVGLTMILPCDIRLASEAAKFGLFFVRMGVVPELASSALWPQMVGSARALEWCLTGRLVPAEEAREAGLVSEVVAADQLLDRALALGEQLSANSALAMQLIRNLLRENASRQDLDAVVAAEGAALAQAYASWEHREAIAAFLEKRVPNFTKQPPTPVR
jgi:enoyl-CoA hydratase/carnithine racemase